MGQNDSELTPFRLTHSACDSRIWTTKHSLGGILALTVKEHIVAANRHPGQVGYSSSSP
jgi:hypothetical protein